MRVTRGGAVPRAGGYARRAGAGLRGSGPRQPKRWTSGEYGAGSGPGCRSWVLPCCSRPAGRRSSLPSSPAGRSLVSARGSPLSRCGCWCLQRGGWGEGLSWVAPSGLAGLRGDARSLRARQQAHHRGQHDFSAGYRTGLHPSAESGAAQRAHRAAGPGVHAGDRDRHVALLRRAAGQTIVTAPDPVRGNILALLSGITYALMLIGLRWMGKTRRIARGGRGGWAISWRFSSPRPAMFPLGSPRPDRLGDHRLPRRVPDRPRVPLAHPRDPAPARS